MDGAATASLGSCSAPHRSHRKELPPEMTSNDCLENALGQDRTNIPFSKKKKVNVSNTSISTTFFVPVPV